MILSIVILSYNTKDLVISSIDSLLKHYKDELEEDKFEIIVVDNASEKETIDAISSKLNNIKNVRLIKSKENLGFGKGCNLGTDNAHGEYVLFLNSDTLVSDKGFLKMADFLKSNPKVAILGGKLINFDGTPQASVGKFYNMINFFIMLFGGEKHGLLRSSPKKTQKVDWVSGACMMVSKKSFDLIGGFDKNIFMYLEDMELSYRARKKGYETYFFPNSQVKHKEFGSSDRTFAIINIYKGLLYFYKKNKSFLEYIVVWISLFLKALGVYILGRLTNNSYYIKTYGQALGTFRQ